LLGIFIDLAGWDVNAVGKSTGERLLLQASVHCRSDIEAGWTGTLAEALERDRGNSLSEPSPN
jgi:hypothetical protein